MSVGSGGKYDAESELALAMTQGKLVALIVVGGTRGTGFSLATIDPRLLPSVVGVLRDVANQVEADARELPRRRGS